MGSKKRRDCPSAVSPPSGSPKLFLARFATTIGLKDPPIGKFHRPTAVEVVTSSCGSSSKRNLLRRRDVSFSRNLFFSFVWLQNHRPNCLGLSPLSFCKVLISFFFVHLVSNVFLGLGRCHTVEFSSRFKAETFALTLDSRTC